MVWYIAAYVISAVSSYLLIRNEYKKEWTTLEADLMAVFLTLAPVANTITTLIFVSMNVSRKLRSEKKFRSNVSSKFFRL